MASQKYEPMLNLALASDETERNSSQTLNLGFNRENNTWTVIVRFSGNIDYLKDYNVEIEYLEGNYAILKVPDDIIRRLSDFSEIIYVEMPKKLYMMVNRGISASCISPLTDMDFSGGALTGKGVICGIIDSGERVIIMSS